VSARFMRGEFFDFKPEFKLWLGTNHKPVIRGTDNAIWDRIRLVPFEYRVPEDEIDPLLPERLRAEADGIFQWALRGCLEWQAHGLINPDEVKAAMGEYRTEMDVLAAFLEDCCDLAPYHEIASKELYAEYRKWCENNAEKMVSQKKFGMRMLERGLTQKRTNHARYWEGIGLRVDGDVFGMSDACDASSQVIPYARAREKTPKPASHASPQGNASPQSGTEIPDLSAYD
jgi:putative DNA primase/helicase